MDKYILDVEWDRLAISLQEESMFICEQNNCTDDEHYCESYAYITEGGILIDICAPDFFSGWGSDDVENYGEYAAIGLPWYGNGEELKEAVLNNVAW
jgi:hypothetical protein